MRKSKESSSNYRRKSILWRLETFEDLKWPKIIWKIVIIGALKSKIFFFYLIKSCFSSSFKLKIVFFFIKKMDEYLF